MGTMAPVPPPKDKEPRWARKQPGRNPAEPEGQRPEPSPPPPPPPPPIVRPAATEIAEYPNLMAEMLWLQVVKLEDRVSRLEARE